MNVLVTGGSGQLGKELKKIVNSSVGTNHYFFYSHKELDICDNKKIVEVIEKQKIDIIINCAALTNFNLCKEREDLARKVNAEGPDTLARISKRFGILLVHISSDYVFDGKRKFGRYSTEDKATPISVYGVTKKEGEDAIINSGCDYFIFRVSWLYGGNGRNFFDTIYGFIKENRTIPIVNDQIGTPTYVGDLAKFLYGILDDKSLGDLKRKRGLYHYSNCGKTSWFNFGRQILKQLKKFGINTQDSKIIPIKTADFESKDVRPKYSPLSVKKVKRIFGVKIQHWKKALIDCIKNNVKKI